MLTMKFEEELNLSLLKCVPLGLQNRDDGITKHVENEPHVSTSNRDIERALIVDGDVSTKLNTDVIKNLHDVKCKCGICGQCTAAM